MKYVLTKKPKGAKLLEGFPGFGLVGTITTEYLVNQLKAELIGFFRIEDIPPMVAVHDGDLVEPMGIYYAKKQNLVILHIMTNVAGLEWKISNLILQLVKELQITEVVSIEGVGSTVPSDDPKAYYYANTPEAKKKFKASKIAPLNEGIILGSTATLLLQAEKLPVSCIFAETHSNLPDSKASAKVIQVIDKYLGLKVDYEPLLKQAEKFENKIKSLMKKSQEISLENKKKQLSYLG